MNLTALHSILRRKGFHFFEGRTNNREDYINFHFSTGHNGRGDSVEIILRGNKVELLYWLYDYTNYQKNGEPQITHTHYTDLDDSKILKILEDELN